MAAAAKKTEQQQSANRQLTETQRWVLGVVLFVFSTFLLAAVVSYYFCWSSDQNFVRWGDMWGAEGGIVTNPTGKMGAILANYVVGEWFGVFGVILPAALIVLALRIINFRPPALRKSVRISLIIMILGSLSLGYLFGSRWGVFGTGLGGTHGIFVSQWSNSVIGAVGTGLVLLLGWILLGIYINSRRTMAVVNRVGKGVFDGSKVVGGTIIDHAAGMVHLKKEKGETEDEEDDIEEADDVEVEEDDREADDSEEGGAFEITDSRQRREEVAKVAADEGLSVVSATERTPVVTVNDAYREGTKYVGGVGRYATEGDAAGVAEVAGTVAGATEPSGIYVVEGEDEDGQKYVGGVGRYADVGGSQSQSSTRTTQEEGVQDGPFQVINRGEGATLSVGGVVEATSERGVRADDKLEVIVAGRSDVQLDDDDIDESLYDPTKELSKYQKPPVELLQDHSVEVQVTEEEVYENKNQIVRTLENFGIKIDKIKATIGPTVTLYEIVPSAGVKISKIKNLEDDIALSLKALGIRIIAPMPGKGTVGIEVPNKDKEIVSMYSVVKTRKFQESNYELPIVLGKTISNETFMIDLAKMPHLLVAGATGQGKSVGLNAIIASLLYKKHPAELKFVMVDPKRVELSLYSKLERHFLAKMMSEEEAILTDTQKVVYTLNALCTEMSERYDLLRAAQVKKISEYNEKFLKRRLNPNKGHKFMPYIVVIVDEFADMIMTAGREVETPITRLAQLARAVGIHLVIATQRPDVKVITGLIKANFPARIAFRVTSMVDSRTIIDQPGANQLIGRGDMLISINGEITRVQCAFIDTPEIDRITEFIGNQRGYSSAYELPDYLPDGEGGISKSADLDQLDPMFEDVARFIVQNQQGSTSSIQRRFSIGYNRAGRIMDQMEASGVVGRADGSKPREVLLTDVQSLEYILSKLDD